MRWPQATPAAMGWRRARRQHSLRDRGGAAPGVAFRPEIRRDAPAPAPCSCCFLSLHAPPPPRASAPSARAERANLRQAGSPLSSLLLLLLYESEEGVEQGPRSSGDLL